MVAHRGRRKHGLGEGGQRTELRGLLLWTGLPLAVGVAIYTAFLFGQAEGRDLWQSTLLPFHLVVQSHGRQRHDPAGRHGAAFSPEPVGLARLTFGIALAVDLFVTLLGEFGMPHASDTAAKAAHAISHGAYRTHFWIGSILVGHVVAFALLLTGWTPAVALGGLLAIAGLYLFEYAFCLGAAGDSEFHET
ncbi:MAG: NrfD/PsrC family molybdoenzyme membrane anchor subunit [Caldilineaceae bacterium]